MGGLRRSSGRFGQKNKKRLTSRNLGKTRRK